MNECMKNTFVICYTGQIMPARLWALYESPNNWFFAFSKSILIICITTETVITFFL